MAVGVIVHLVEPKEPAPPEENQPRNPGLDVRACNQQVASLIEQCKTIADEMPWVGEMLDDFNCDHQVELLEQPGTEVLVEIVAVTPGGSFESPGVEFDSGHCKTTINQARGKRACASSEVQDRRLWP